jgi:2-polyprenyl-6-hydroxyphenyl methylase/3-demethylubiquinone-9 3-methyltransferase
VPSRRSRNDPAQYDELAGEWWRPDGPFAALHWLAKARAELIPPPSRQAPALLDIGCGGGLLAAHVPGYRHVGVDISQPSLAVAAAHGVEAVLADAGALPFPDGSFELVVAGEIFEHVDDLDSVVAESVRVLRNDGLLVFDTINQTRIARLSLVTLAERLPGGPPPGCHDPQRFVSPVRLRQLFARHGAHVEVWGLRPSARDYLAFLLGRRRTVRMLRTPSLAAVYQGLAWKAERDDVGLGFHTTSERARSVGESSSVSSA